MQDAACWSARQGFRCRKLWSFALGLAHRNVSAGDKQQAPGVLTHSPLISALAPCPVSAVQRASCSIMAASLRFCSGASWVMWPPCPASSCCSTCRQVQAYIYHQISSVDPNFVLA